MSGFYSAGLFDVIPDSVVSRPEDNSDFDQDGKRGVQITTDVEWPEIGARLSSNMGSDATRAYIYRVSDGNLLGDVDISSLSAGDTLTFDLSSDLVSGESYNIVLDAEGSEYLQGINNDPDFPYVSSDGDLTIESAGSGETGSTTGFVSSFSEVGNVGFD